MLNQWMHEIRARQNEIARMISDEVLEAVIGYTDWLATQLVKTRLGARSLPRSREIPHEEIAKKYGVSVPLLKAVIERLHRLPQIPVVGKVVEGRIIPEKNELEQWREMFDWGRPG